jgi:excisionase family DNA binding protein
MHSLATADENRRLLLTVDQAADRLSLGRTSMYSLINSGTVPSVKIGRSRRVRAEDLEAYITSLASR